MKTYNFFCINCGETFTATRSDARTHSHRCRTDLGRALKMAEMYDESDADEAKSILADVKEKVNRLEAIMSISPTLKGRGLSREAQGRQVD